MQDNNKRNFDAEAPTWEDNPERVRLANAISSGILGSVPFEPDMDVLDYGCGTGMIALAIQPHVRSVTAADSSAGMLEVLSAKCREAGIANVATRQLDLETDPVPTDSFHAIVCSMTLHHIADTARLLRQFGDMLHTGGYLCLADLDTEDGCFHADNTGVRHFGFDRAHLKELLETSGFGAVTDTTAIVVTKPVAGSDPGQFPVFLITARKVD